MNHRRTTRRGNSQTSTIDFSIMRRFPTFSIRRTLLAATAIAMTTQLNAADDGVAFFEKRIRPALVKECFACHSSQAKSLKGGLSLETRIGVLQGGDTGPALVPGKANESLLLSALKHDGDVRMPPKGKLSESVIRDFQRWI